MSNRKKAGFEARFSFGLLANYQSARDDSSPANSQVRKGGLPPLVFDDIKAGVNHPSQPANYSRSLLCFRKRNYPVLLTFPALAFGESFRLVLLLCRQTRQ